MDFAVLVIDMQNGFIHPEGSVPSVIGPLPGIDDAVTACRALLADDIRQSLLDDMEMSERNAA